MIVSLPKLQIVQHMSLSQNTKHVIEQKCISLNIGASDWPYSSKIYFRQHAFIVLGQHSDEANEILKTSYENDHFSDLK